MSEHDTAPSPSDLTEPSAAAPVALSSRRRWIVSIFGDITRDGSWPPHQRLSPFALFGDIDLDLREASLPAGDVAVRAIAPFGNVTVLVPPGARVDVGGFTLFGSKRIDVRDAGTNGASPVIRVTGFTLFGSLKVWSP